MLTAVPWDKVTEYADGAYENTGKRHLISEESF